MADVEEIWLRLDAQELKRNENGVFGNLRTSLVVVGKCLWPAQIAEVEVWASLAAWSANGILVNCFRTAGYVGIVLFLACTEVRFGEMADALDAARTEATKMGREAADLVANTHPAVAKVLPTADVVHMMPTLLPES